MFTLMGHQASIKIIIFSIPKKYGGGVYDWAVVIKGAWSGVELEGGPGVNK